MKTNKPITMKTSKLTTQAISTTVLLISAWTANAALFFQENFDTIGQAALVSPGAGLTTPLASILPGWAVTANNATQTNVKIGNGIIGGVLYRCLPSDRRWQRFPPLHLYHGP
jgi:hypothetical protein